MIPISLILIALCAIHHCLYAEPIPVLEKQGAMHGFILLKDQNGKETAIGDQTNVVHGSAIHSRLIFRFRDGSVDDDVTVFRQGRTFQLIRDHHIQRGPSFPNPADVTIDVPKNEVTWAEKSDQGTQSKSKHMDLPADLANGMVSMLVENFPRSASELKVSFLAGSKSPRIVHLIVKRDGTDKALVGSSSREAERFNVHIDIGGIAGAVAPVIGKQPPDFKLWALDGGVPTFIKMVGPLYEGGPIWTAILIEPRLPTAEGHQVGY